MERKVKTRYTASSDCWTGQSFIYQSIQYKFMYSVLKSKRVAFTPSCQTGQHSPLIFCAFLNEQRVIALFQKGNFSIVSTKQNAEKRVVFEDCIDQNGAILDCKKIKNNVCAVITSNVDTLYLIKYVSDLEVMVGNVFIHEMTFFKQLEVSTEVIPFGPSAFVIKCQNFANRTTYFACFKEISSTEFNYYIHIVNYEQDPVQTGEEIFRALVMTRELCFFKQQEVEEATWSIKIIPLFNHKDNKQIQLNEHFSGNHLIQDIVATGSNRYLVFASDVGQKKVDVFGCELFQKNGKFAQKIDCLSNFQVSSGLFLQILDVNAKENYFMLKSSCNSRIKGQIYNNFIELRYLSTGKLIDQLPCNIKSIDVSSSKTQLLDYSQAINEHSQTIFHIRYIFKKRSLYHFMLDKSSVFKNSNLRDIQADIVNLLL